MTQAYVQELKRALLERGFWPTWSALECGWVQIGFDFLPGRHPSWLRAFQLPVAAATPDAYEQLIRDWQAQVLADLNLGQPSPVVRRLIAEHGQELIVAAMGGVLHAA
jgi:hypothetical protein